MRRRWGADEERRAAVLLASGADVASVAETLGRSERAVRRRFFVPPSEFPPPSRRRIPQDVRDRVVVLTREGRTAVEIAEIVGTTARTVVRIRHDAGVARQPYPSMTDEELGRAADLLADGCSYAEVARTLGRSHHAISARFPGYAWSRSDASQLAVAMRRANEQMRVVYA